MEQIILPDNIIEFVSSRYETVVTVTMENFNVNEYGSIPAYLILIKMPERHCIHCGYSELYGENPYYDPGVLHQRHTYSDVIWREVFCWKGTAYNKDEMERLFSEWLDVWEKRISNEHWEAVKEKWKLRKEYLDERIKNFPLDSQAKNS